MSTIFELTGTTYMPAARAGSRSTASGKNFTEHFTQALEQSVEDLTAETAVQSTAKASAETVAETASSAQQIETALTEALGEAVMNSVMTTATSGSASYSSLSGLGVEGMLLASAATGEISENQMALFMLCMLLNTAGEDSDTSMLYNIMMTLLTQASDGGESGTGSETQTVQGWDGSSSRQARYSGAVKSAIQPTATGTGLAAIPSSAWIPTTPGILNLEGERSAQALRDVIDQFDVENSARYTPRNGVTYCNIYVWDVTNALGCEIPHYVDSVTGEPRTYPDIAGAYELDANGVHDWLVNKGAQYGWREVTAQQAQEYANEGYPVVGAWDNPGAIGHVQIVCPSEDGTYNEERGPAVAQAGGRNTGYTYQSTIYGSQRIQQVRYFVHD